MKNQAKKNGVCLDEWLTMDMEENSPIYYYPEDEEFEKILNLEMKKGPVITEVSLQG